GRLHHARVQDHAYPGHYGRNRHRHGRGPYPQFRPTRGDRAGPPDGRERAAAGPWNDDLSGVRPSGRCQIILRARLSAGPSARPTLANLSRHRYAYSPPNAARMRMREWINWYDSDHSI